MPELSLVLIIFVIAFHIFAFFLESVVWQRPFTLRIFKNSPEDAAATRTLALNQGVYNLFLAAGLVWGLIASGPSGFEITIFFLSCVVIAGVVGGLSVSKRIFILQAVPALLALTLLLLPF
jgi:putative membrane protein